MAETMTLPRIAVEEVGNGRLGMFYHCPRCRRRNFWPGNFKPGRRDFCLRCGTELIFTEGRRDSVPVKLR